MSTDVVIEFIKAILLGKSGPDLNADPFVIAAWLCVPGLLKLAHVYAGRGRDGVAGVLVLLTLVLSGGLVVNGYSKIPPADGKPSKPPARPPGKSAPEVGQRPPPPETPSLAPATTSFEILDGQTLIGADLGSAAALRHERLTLDSCKQQCLARAECAAFTFDKDEGSCILKAAVKDPKPFPGAVSGIKRRAVGQARP